jgi:hypothetical protein
VSRMVNVPLVSGSGDILAVFRETIGPSSEGGVK